MDRVESRKAKGSTVLRAIFTALLTVFEFLFLPYPHRYVIPWPSCQACALPPSAPALMYVMQLETKEREGGRDLQGNFIRLTNSRSSAFKDVGVAARLSRPWSRPWLGLHRAVYAAPLLHSGLRGSGMFGPSLGCYLYLSDVDLPWWQIHLELAFCFSITYCRRLHTEVKSSHLYS